MPNKTEEKLKETKDKLKDLAKEFYLNGGKTRELQKFLAKRNLLDERGMKIAEDAIRYRRHLDIQI